MRSTRLVVRLFGSAALALVLLACGGGGDGGGGTAPPVVASVSIVSPGIAPAFKSFARIASFGAEARDASNRVVPGAVIGWSSTNPGVATVSPTGIVTSVGNGTTVITANANGISSPGMSVTVEQVFANVEVSAGSLSFTSLNASQQLIGRAVDSSGATIVAAGQTSWSRAGTGATAIVASNGLVSAIGVGASDTAVTGFAGVTVRVPIAVAQLVTTVQVTGTGSDTLRTTGRTKQYAAAALDAGGVNIPGRTFVWSSSAPGTASVDAGTGTATAVSDGTTNVIATTGTVSGQRVLTVRRFASTFSLSPAAATIVTPLGTQIFLGIAEDSVATALPIGWTSRTTSALTLNGASGAQVTATGRGNGTSFVVMQAGARADSALVTVSGQITAPLTATVNVGAGNLFRSSLNLTQNPAVDTIAVGGTVTWQGQGGTHTVQSQGSPSFTSSGTLGSGTYLFTFNVAGTYQYDCAIHGAVMTGRIVVR